MIALIPPSRGLSFRETCVYAWASGSLRSPGEAGVQESPCRPGSDYAGPSLQMPLVQCPGIGVAADPCVFMALPQGPEAGLEGRLRPGRPPATGGAAGGSTKDRARARSLPWPTLAFGIVLGPLGALLWLTSPCWGEGLARGQQRGRFKKEAGGRTPGYYSRVDLLLCSCHLLNFEHYQWLKEIASEKWREIMEFFSIGE